jgi:hypothetical protein
MFSFITPHGSDIVGGFASNATNCDGMCAYLMTRRSNTACTIGINMVNGLVLQVMHTRVSRQLL